MRRKSPSVTLRSGSLAIRSENRQGVAESRQYGVSGGAGVRDRTRSDGEDLQHPDHGRDQGRDHRDRLGNLTDGTVRVSLHNGAKAMTSVLMKQETETWLNDKILGVTRLRLQVADVRSGYGPYVAVDSILLCTN